MKKVFLLLILLLVLGCKKEEANWKEVKSFMNFKKGDTVYFIVGDGIRIDQATIIGFDNHYVNVMYQDETLQTVFIDYISKNPEDLERYMNWRNNGN